MQRLGRRRLARRSQEGRCVGLFFRLQRALECLSERHAHHPGIRRIDAACGEQRQRPLGLYVGKMRLESFDKLLPLRRDRSLQRMQRPLHARSVLLEEIGKKVGFFAKGCFEIRDQVGGNLGKAVFSILFVVLQDPDAQAGRFEVYVHHEHFAPDRSEPGADVIERLCPPDAALERVERDEDRRLPVRPGIRGS